MVRVFQRRDVGGLALDSTHVHGEHWTTLENSSSGTDMTCLNMGDERERKFKSSDQIASL